MKSRSFFGTLLFFGCASLALSGCKGVGNTITMQSPFGTKRDASPGQSLSLPKGFPSDIPLYPGARVRQTIVRPQLTTVELETADDFSKVMAFYKKALPESGWTATDQGGNAKYAGIRATKGARNFSVFAGDHGETMKTGVTLMVPVSPSR